MAARSLASLSLSFGLVSIPVKLYTATESSSAVRFNLLSKDGSRVRQQYISEQTQKVVERADMIKGYEFEKGRFVTFAPDELKALEESASHMVDIVAFIPEQSVDPLYYDKAYFIAPDKRGGKPYSLLREAMSRTGRCAIAKWASKGKSHVVQIRPVEGGLVFQQLLFADEVRNIAELNIEEVAVSEAELKLAIQLIEQASEEEYDPTQYKDEEKARILAAIDAKIAGKHIVAPEPVEDGAGGQVIDLMDALRASLSKKGTAAAKGKAAAAAPPARKSARRGAAAEPTPIRRTTKKSA
ncbi:Ku protein [Cupriavidus taiwanensis]|uniref:Non-homologous end joining protein Ku n=1 Tax=Cupriavidus taiwanensis TaxID=164546 RepID=A0A7Z7JER8_9BURK|nr:Ku protein [Cupriavidus taiwanensis]SOY70961.1 Putative Ku domain containing protein [Cupriavidus taiwanensis]SOZ09559.1 Putative Ku domain containing protein [Cupriavidus taiwanensis]SOZ11682.1 Putative Ku domain containing protein [Cupriavidus taiwanensis]SOZ43036.1 Putative Ku domain containing protein [Cupriavidus taiwanensis]SPC22283.1 Putative Ku domain containing protein [Cupriavidus taiwanensis]